MAAIVLGMALSHSSQLSTPVEKWHLHVERHKNNPEIDFRRLSFTAPDWLQDHLTSEVWESKYQSCQNAIETMSTILEEVSPDILVIIGNDHKELLLRENMPVFSIFWGDKIYDVPPDKNNYPVATHPAFWAIHGDSPELYETESNLGQHLIHSLVQDEFDVSQLSYQPDGRTLGHSFTFVKRRLFQNRPMPKIVPIMINTCFTPNVPSSKRCYEFGVSLQKAIESWDSDQTVAVIASGGLSHYIIDEELDQLVINGIKNKDKKSLVTIPKQRFVSGSSEILNWITAAGALEDLDMEVVDYIPGYLTPAGTGCGMGFVYWK